MFSTMGMIAHDLLELIFGVQKVEQRCLKITASRKQSFDAIHSSIKRFIAPENPAQIHPNYAMFCISSDSIIRGNASTLYALYELFS